ncbi:TetR/AcrR family transcriptional regulator [Streptomyces catenulae]|uniref:TetR/AcrR family transcriptional regulator n=1 Tax=Streptomyces catenulae TaxID=66875 RepID=A0ABV2Z1S8_9ACTN|nr:TetR/AcrR family transcriptional regulator [Streptomyces catenulae]
MTPAHQPPGEIRPGGRTARTRAAVLAAVQDELSEGGFAALSMERIAQRSGIHLATIYRRWRSVEGLVCELLTEASTAIALPDTGSLPEDLRLLARRIGTFYTAAPMRRLVEAVVSSAGRNSRAETVLADFFHDRLRLAGGLVRRGIERGEVPPDTDPEAVMSAVGAPFYYRILIARGPVDADLAESTATAVWAATLAGAYRVGGAAPVVVRQRTGSGERDRERTD